MIIYSNVTKDAVESVRIRKTDYISNITTYYVAGAYDEIIKGYDHNGNMTGLLRYTQAAAGSGRILLDDLSYSYKDGGSNQLSAAGDAGNGTSGLIDGAASAEEYTYDDNGSLSLLYFYKIHTNL